MSKRTSLEVEPRDRAGKGAARAARRDGMVPGVIYGDKKPPVMFNVPKQRLMAELNAPGFWTRQFEVKVNGQSHRTLCQNIQTHPINDQPIHIDFLRISATSQITVDVPVKFLNEAKSPGLKRGGVLNIVRHEIEVACTPDNIPDLLEVDLAGVDIGDSIHISQISLPDGVQPVISDRDFTVATLAAPTVMRSEAEEGEAEGAGEAAKKDEAD